MAKIVMLSRHDYAGSGWRICEAVRRHGAHNIIHVRSHGHAYGYPTDCDLSSATSRQVSEIEDMVHNADALHFKGDDLPSQEWDGIRLPKISPCVITVGGSAFRRRRSLWGLSKQEQKVESKIGQQRHDISDYRSSAEARVALTPDLNYPSLGGVWIPAPIDVSDNEYSFTAPRNEIVIGHSPSHRLKKGTDEILVPSVESLKKRGFNVRLEIIEGVSHEEAVSRKRSLHLFWDQARVGAYGNSALEAMRFGIPTMCWIDTKTIEQAHGRLDDCPIVNFDPTPESCVDALERVLNRETLTALSQKTMAWTKRNHSYETVGGQYSDLYDSIIEQQRCKQQEPSGLRWVGSGPL